MKKLNLFFILAVTLCITAGCEKDRQSGGSLKIEAKVINGNEYNDLIDEVKVITTHTWKEVTPTEVVTCDYKNGGFSLTLPKKVIESAYLFTLDGMTLWAGDIYANFYAYKNNIEVGKFYYGTSDSKIIARFYYCYKDNVIFHFLRYDPGIELDVKKGWNTIYFATDGDWYYKKPNAELNWYFVPN